jgi:hypothetical protein
VDGARLNAATAWCVSGSAVAEAMNKQGDAGANVVSVRRKPSPATQVKNPQIARGLAVAKVG